MYACTPKAARDGKYEVVKEWLEWHENHPIIDRKGRKINNPISEKDPDGLTALHYAARFNRFKILQYLVSDKPGVCIGCVLCVRVCACTCACTVCDVCTLCHCVCIVCVLYAHVCGCSNECVIHKIDIYMPYCHCNVVGSICVCIS